MLELHTTTTHRIDDNPASIREGDRFTVDGQTYAVEGWADTKQTRLRVISMCVMCMKPFRRTISPEAFSPQRTCADCHHPLDWA